MLRRRPSVPGPEASEARIGARDGTPDAALDAVAAILRTLAEWAPRGAETAAHLDAWARHVLVLEPPPGAPVPADPTDRDWVGLRRQVVSHLREDREAFGQTTDDLQDAVWLVVAGLSQTVAGDERADADATAQLERLRAAAGGSAAELKAAAMETVARLSQIADARSARQVRLARELGERVEVLREELVHTRREADIDPLTQLANRNVLRRELPRAVQVRTLVDEPACLAVVDLDDFKQINDLHGHQTGDLALEAFARTLAGCFPRRRDVVARFGGDEFAVILRDASAQDGCRLVERFLHAVRALAVPGPNGPLLLTASVGVAEALLGEPSDSWFARADRALYDAKADGRDRVAMATDVAPGPSRLVAQA